MNQTTDQVDTAVLIETNCELLAALKELAETVTSLNEKLSLI